MVGESREMFEEALKDAIFRAAQADTTIVWAPDNGETLAAFLPYANCVVLPRMTHMPKVDAWRTVERYLIQGAAEHGSHILLVYNRHQPSSTLRPFPITQRIQFCKCILQNAMDYCANQDSKCIGFCFGGDANCGVAQWSPAFNEVSSWEITFNTPSFLQGRRRVSADLMVVEIVKQFDVIVYENISKVEGREKQHDPMAFQFSFKPREPADGGEPASGGERATVEPAIGGEPASGASEHAAASASDLPAHDS